MGVKAIVSKLNEIFSIENKKKKHYQGIQELINKLKEKEEKIKYKFENEKDEIKRAKQKRSLQVIKAQQNKAEKLLNA